MGKLFMVTIILVLVIIGMLIVNTKNIKLDNEEGRKQFVVEYGKWAFKSIKNFASIVGYAIDQDWSIDEEKNGTDGE